MAGKKPEEPKPTLYNPLHDFKPKEVIKNFQDLYKTEAKEKAKTEREKTRRGFRQRLYFDLAQHGIDEKTGDFKRTGYSDMKDNKKKWVENLVNSLAVDGASMHQGDAMAKGLASNIDELRDYVEKYMTTEKLKSYDAIIEKLSNSKNIIADFDEDPELAELLDNYVQRINPSARKNRQHQLHISTVDYTKDVQDYANDILKKQGYQLAPYAPSQTTLEIIAGAADPDYKAPTKSKYLIPLPKDDGKKKGK